MQINKFCNHLYDDSTDGYIQLVQLNHKENDIIINNTKKCGLTNTALEFKDNKDVFLTPNTMYIPQRRVDNIRQFRALFQDIDCSGVGLEKAETVYMIWVLYYEGKIPKPSMVIDSGRGVHVYWRIKNAPYNALQTWQELQDYIYYKLKHLGADKKATDGARILRLPGSINSRCDLECRVLYIDNDIEYSMYDLRAIYLKNSKRTNKLKNNENKVVNNKFTLNRIFNSYSLHMNRAIDLKTLCRIRKYDMTGYRNMVIHCYAYWKGIYVRDFDELEKDVMELNSSFIEPLRDREVQAILRCVPKAIDKFITYEQGIRSGERKTVSKGMRDKAGYWYKNDTLIDILGITQKEEKYMNTIISVSEKYRRNNEKRTPRNKYGLTKKQQELKDLKKKILELKEIGLSNRAIGRKFNISEGKVRTTLRKVCCV